MNDSKSINDSLFLESKSLQSSGTIPFPSYGSGWGASPIYESEEAWSSWVDSFYGLGTVNDVQKYRQLLGDLSRNSLVMAAVRFLGDSLLEPPIQVKEKKGGASGKKGESQVIEDHRLTALWNNPNDFYDSTVLKKGIGFSLVLQGNAYILKNFNDLGPSASWPVELWWEPHWTIRPVWPINGSQFISNYEVNRNGQWYPIPLENVIHIRDGIHPYNQRIGLSGNDAVLRELYGDSEAANYYAALMGGSGIPGFLVSIDKEMKMDQPKLEAFEKMIVRKTTGDRKGQPLVAKGARAYKLGFNPRELDLRESRYMAEDRFCAVQGIPAVVLELGSGQAHSIFKNVESAMERAWRSYVCPKLTMIESQLTHNLLRDFEGSDNVDRFCEFDLSQIQALQEDQDAKAKRLGGMYTAGFIMKSEARSGMNYGPSDPTNPRKDDVFAVTRGQVLVLPGEQPLPQGESIVDILTGEVRIDTTLKAPETGQQGIIGIPGGENVSEGSGASKNALLEATKAIMAPISHSQQILDLLPDGFLNPQANWTNFPDSMGSIGIPRTAMPQVLSKNRGAMVNFLRGRGIKVTKEDVLPGSLKPSQTEYRPDKVESAKEWNGPERPLLVSSDGYVADGHHQWIADLDSPDDPIPIFRCDEEILPLLLTLAMFPSSGVKDENDVAKFWSKSMPGKRSFVTPLDIQQTISFLKKHRYDQAAEMMTASTLKPAKKSNGDSIVL